MLAMAQGVTVYQYQKCGTCRKASKWLDARGIAYRDKAIRETPPSKAELQRARKQYGSFKPLLNTSSKDYREAGLKDRLDGMSDAQVIDLLRDNGNLVKRPFVVRGDEVLVGFKEDEWKAFFA